MTRTNKFMTIIRNKRINNFTTIQNSLINDQRLGWHDLGMLVYLLSKPDTWKVRVDVLVKERNLGKNAVYEILKRLREYGYAKLVKFADGSTEWYIYDNPNPQNPDQENRDQANPNPQNPDQANPDQANPDQGFRDVLVNTDVKKRLISSKERLIVKERCGLGLQDKPKPEKSESITSETWDSYSKTYFNRYGVEPIRNAKVSGQLSQFVARVGKAEAPHIAAFYVTHNNHFYVQKMHTVGMLLADAEKLRTEWVTNRQMTNTQAKQTDKTQARGNIFNKLIEEARANATK